MARLPRYVLPGQPQHVIQRGNNRCAMFAAPVDRKVFLDCLTTACTSHSCHVHAYVLMTNHVHMLMTPQTPAGIGKVMQSLGRRYVRYFNDTYRRSGTLWEGRYRATLIDSEAYLFTCYRYIELNPVRAGLVAGPADYPWSSYGANALGRRDALVRPHARYSALGAGAESRRSAYRALFLDAIDEATLRRIRESTHTGWALGDDRFRLEITKRLNRRAYPAPLQRLPD